MALGLWTKKETQFIKAMVKTGYLAYQSSMRIYPTSTYLENVQYTCVYISRNKIVL